MDGVAPVASAPSARLVMFKRKLMSGDLGAARSGEGDAVLAVVVVDHDRRLPVEDRSIEGGTTITR